MNLFPILLFAIGSSLGSFLNVVIDRLPSGKSIIFSRSHCEHCHNQIKNYDLIPIFSYILLRGRCRHCHARISFRLFLVEVLSGALFVLLWNIFGSSLLIFILSAVITLTLLGILFIDVEDGVIPDLLILILLGASIIWVFTLRYSLVEHVLTGIGVFLFFLAIFTLTRGRGMGFGDVKLSLPLGFLFGFPEAIYLFYIAFLTGAVVSLALVAMKKKKLRGSTIPFGPFLCFGAFSVLIAGRQIAEFAMQFIKI